MLQLPGIAEAATIGVPDRIYGEEVASYVVLAAGAALTEAEIVAFAGTRLAAFKTPKKIYFSAGLPNSERGKLDRKALAAEWRRAHAAP